MSDSLGLTVEWYAYGAHEDVSPMSFFFHFPLSPGYLDVIARYEKGQLHSRNPCQIALEGARAVFLAMYRQFPELYHLDTLQVVHEPVTQPVDSATMHVLTVHPSPAVTMYADFCLVPV